MTAAALSDELADVSATERQIINSVKYGRRCTFVYTDREDEPVIGYVAGLDRYRYFVLSPQKDNTVRHYLIHKTCPMIEIHPESTFETESEETRKVMNQIMGSFRNRVREQQSVTGRRNRPSSPRS